VTHVARLLKRDVEGSSVEYDRMVDKEERRDGMALMKGCINVEEGFVDGKAACK